MSGNYFDMTVPSLSLASSRRKPQIPTKDTATLTSSNQLSSSRASSSSNRFSNPIENNYTFFNQNFQQPQQSIPSAYNTSSGYSNIGRPPISRNSYLQNSGVSNDFPKKSEFSQDIQKSKVESIDQMMRPLAHSNSTDRLKASNTQYAYPPKQQHPPMHSSTSIPSFFPTHTSTDYSSKTLSSLASNPELLGFGNKQQTQTNKSYLPPRPTLNAAQTSPLLLETSSSQHANIQIQIRNKAIIREMDAKQAQFERRLKQLLGAAEECYSDLYKIAEKQGKRQEREEMDISVCMGELDEMCNESAVLHHSFIHELNQVLLK